MVRFVYEPQARVPLLCTLLELYDLPEEVLPQDPLERPGSREGMYLLLCGIIHAKCCLDNRLHIKINYHILSLLIK